MFEGNVDIDALDVSDNNIRCEKQCKTGESGGDYGGRYGV